MVYIHVWLARLGRPAPRPEPGQLQGRPGLRQGLEGEFEMMIIDNANDVIMTS